jgi:hypothetical protein
MIQGRREGHAQSGSDHNRHRLGLAVRLWSWSIEDIAGGRADTTGTMVITGAP